MVQDEVTTCCRGVNPGLETCWLNLFMSVNICLSMQIYEKLTCRTDRIQEIFLAKISGLKYHCQILLLVTISTKFISSQEL